MIHEKRSLIVKCVFLVCITLILITMYVDYNTPTDLTWRSMFMQHMNTVKEIIIHVTNLKLRYSSKDPLGLDTNKWPWFLKNGTIKPNYDTSVLSSQLWPTNGTEYDRIPEQLMFFPYKEGENTTLKKIYIYNPHDIEYWNYVLGQQTFMDQKCPVNSCFITHSPDEASNASAVIFQFYANFALGKQPWNRSYDQIWILYTLESPFLTPDYKDYNNMFNWTMTYRLDSEIRWEYARWTYFNEFFKTAVHNTNFAANKTKKVAWFVSNCNDKNGRKEYAKELSKYISVDIYGKCGKLKCDRSIADQCFNKLKNYKFYLAFENANCKHYITEKLFQNALGNQLLPIVMGARPQDYERLAPYKSYIHVDDFDSPKELADYLHKLDQNDTLYNEYFQWRGTGEFYNSHFLCRLCALLHDKNMPRKSYDNLNEWWRGPGVCLERGPWPLEQ